MPGFLEDSDLLERSDAIIRPSSGGTSYPSWWRQAVSDANGQAASWLMGRLMSNGITAAQALTWTGGAGWQAELGLYFLSCRARLDLARSNDESIVKELPDPRASWENIPLLDANNALIVPVVVTGVESGQVGYSRGPRDNRGRQLRGDNVIDQCTGGFRRF